MLDFGVVGLGWRGRVPVAFCLTCCVVVGLLVTICFGCGLALFVGSVG